MAVAPSSRGPGAVRPVSNRPKTDPLVSGIYSTASALGMDPLDLATIMSYETGGTMDPLQRGPTTPQWGQHRGLIQFGEPQSREYGVDWDNPLDSQLGPEGAVANYFRRNGWDPSFYDNGEGLLQAYSIVNAGGPNRFGASDTKNGGAPGDVRDKVENQMAGHRQRAMELLGMEGVTQSAVAGGGTASPGAGSSGGFPTPTAPRSPQLGGSAGLAYLKANGGLPRPDPAARRDALRPRLASSEEEYWQMRDDAEGGLVIYDYAANAPRFTPQDRVDTDTSGLEGAIAETGEARVRSEREILARAQEDLKARRKNVMLRALGPEVFRAFAQGTFASAMPEQERILREQLFGVREQQANTDRAVNEGQAETALAQERLRFQTKRADDTTNREIARLNSVGQMDQYMRDTEGIRTAAEIYNKIEEQYAADRYALETGDLDLAHEILKEGLSEQGVIDRAQAGYDFDAEKARYQGEVDIVEKLISEGGGAGAGGTWDLFSGFSGNEKVDAALGGYRNAAGTVGVTLSQLDELFDEATTANDVDKGWLNWNWVTGDADTADEAASRVDGMLGTLDQLRTDVRENIETLNQEYGRARMSPEAQAALNEQRDHFERLLAQIPPPRERDREGNYIQNRDDFLDQVKAWRERPESVAVVEQLRILSDPAYRSQVGSAVARVRRGDADSLAEAYEAEGLDPRKAGAFEVDGTPSADADLLNDILGSDVDADSVRSVLESRGLQPIQTPTGRIQ